MAETKISAMGNLYSTSQVVGDITDYILKTQALSFGDVMDQMSGNQDTNVNVNVNVDGGAISADPAQAYDRYQYRDNSVNEYQDTPYEVSEETTDAVRSFAEETISTIKDTLGVTDDDIAEAMENLGFMILDLTDQGNLALLVGELTGTSDTSALLLNSDLSTVMNNVAELTSELLDSLGISMQELKEALNEAANAAVPVQSADVQGDQPVIDEAVLNEPVSTVQEANPDTVTTDIEKASEPIVVVEEMPAKTEGVPVQSKESDDKSPVVNTDDVTLSADPDENPVAVYEKTDKTESDKQSRDFAGKDQKGNDNAAGTVGQSEQQIPVTETENIGGTEFSAKLDVDEIIRQIVDYVKVTASNDETTLEMQLNPEHLGKLYIELTAKEGNVSAHITAQNEAVKEALEAQMITLKENLNQAGVKVDAVEVTVGSHEFEKNLEQNARNEEQEAERKEAASKQMRSIRLDSLDELSGLMTDEEALVAQMMAEQGNTMNLRA
jgi:flagellar hook-length control protein FliK